VAKSISGRERLKIPTACSQEFLEQSDTPQKRTNDQRYRSRNESRLDRTWTNVAEVVDRDSATVCEVVLRMYYGNADGDADVTHRFLADLIPIEERLKTANSTTS